MIETQTSAKSHTADVNEEVSPGGTERRVSILGVQITDVTKRTALALMERALQAGHGRCQAVYIVNAHTLNLAAEESQYRDVLHRGDLVLNDGIGVHLAARLRGITLRDNLIGTDLIPELLDATSGRGYRYFLLGATNETIEAAAAYARQRFPGWTLVGQYQGYMRRAGDDAIVEQINAAKVDLLLVGMGNPLQENWIHKHREQLHVALAIGVGGMFAFWGGKLERAPIWVRRIRCEWVYLLVRQPYKWRRYILGNPKFLYRITRELKADLAKMGGRARE